MLSGNKEVTEKGRSKVAFIVKDGSTVYKGSLVILVAGMLQAAAGVANAIFAGISMEKVTGSSNLEKAEVQREGVFLLKGAGFTQADVGKVVYASDDETVSTTQGTNEVAVGRINSVESATSVYVDINTL